MSRRPIFCSAIACLVLFAIASGGAAAERIDPYANSSYKPPPHYKGPVFHLNHKYPTKRPAWPDNPPWIQALKGKPISQDNALDYVKALKDHIAKDMRKLILNYAKWDAEKGSWYNMPWLFSITEPIHGTYVGGTFPHSVFPLSGLKKDMATYVVVYYNDRAGYTLGQIWGANGMKPNVKKAQYQEGAIIVKVALTTATKDDWSPLDGAALWDLCAPPAGAKKGTPPNFFKASLFQFDIIVKDSMTAPQSTWVFTTLVYNKNTKGDAWDRMVPLGAMWGNDPDINSVIEPNTRLQQSVINPMAPLFATETLGYGGRLSGPNDGAIAQDVLIDGELKPRLRVSSCMSCHGVAEWPMRSFLLPGPGEYKRNDAARPKFQGDFEYLFKPGTVAFNRWFQSRSGDVPQNRGTVALDYHMNLAFKALPNWAKYTKQNLDQLYQEAPPGLRRLLLNPELSGKNGRLIRPLD